MTTDNDSLTFSILQSHGLRIQTEPMKVLMRSYLSTHHIWSAYHFSALAKQIEDEHVGRSRFDWNHRAYTIGAVTCGVAFLEAAVNEIYKDAVDEHQSYIQTLGADGIRTLRLIWELTEGQNKFVRILDKYQWALKYLGREPIDTGRALFENAQLVVELRNALIHFKPETGGGGDQSKFEQKLAHKLGGEKYPTSKMFEGSAGNPFFPDHCLGYGCCAWTIDSVKGFADEFFRQIGIVPNYQIVLPKLLAEAGL